ncbi:Sugar phosphatase YidA [Cucurbita argyrosperma subsp. argyrosperma]|nr:Sugar phosphatase YidA [Cucurbita argyrosperma subsp. argyrosperma]
MLLRASPLLRASHRPFSSGVHMALAAHLPVSPNRQSLHSWRSSSHLPPVCQANGYDRISTKITFPQFVRSFYVLSGTYNKVQRPCGRIFCGQREYRKVRRRVPKTKKKELELNVSICIEEKLPDDPELLSIAEMLRLNVPKALKLAFNNLKDSQYKTRDSSINDVGLFESVEMSVLLCNDEFICKLNKEWRDEDHATDVLSMSQHVPELKLPILMLGDIVISVETAARQAEERGHTLLDEIRILLVHGLLHLLGFDHEISEEAEVEMEKEEELLLKSLEWKGKGLIQSAIDAETNSNSVAEVSDDHVLCVRSYYSHVKDRKKEGSLRFYRPRFSYIFCDMDGTLLNSKSQITPTTVKALKEALSRGVKVVIATGKGLLVYGRQGKEIYRRNLDQDICREACLYSLEKNVPLIAFGEGRCLTLFDHPLTDALHTIYHEPKAEVMSSVDNLLAAAEIQKLLFLDTAEGVSRILRPYWSEASGEHASVVQAVPDMLEIVPCGTSKGSGVKLLLDHLGVSSEEVMAIGDGENDIEMLELASLGIAMSNGAEKTKAVANLIGPSNDEDGVAEVIYRYAF